ncbi:MAG: thiamine phosphate synthase [Planctomycetes bacterium]|nr:thiamine phosphate synthase [Planctomycetota bacterium]
MYRIIDVNINRVRESLRVIEDYVRFSLNHEPLFKRIKELRHAFVVAANSVFVPKALLAARDTENDAGAVEPAVKRVKKTSQQHIVIANLKRLQESLRVLEEYSIISSPEAAKKFSALRFQAYQLEKSILLMLFPSSILNSAWTYVLLTESVGHRPDVEMAVECIKGGADILQLREKSMNTSEIIKRAEKIRRLTWDAKVLFIINDRVDIAQTINADGVHIGREDMSIGQARRLLGADKIIGATAHNVKEALSAQAQGADYVSVGPVFSAKTKLDTLPEYSMQKDLKPCGMEFVLQAARQLKIPFFAIGGIDEKNISILKAAGVKRVAVCGSVLKQKNISKAVGKIKLVIGL